MVTTSPDEEKDAGALGATERDGVMALAGSHTGGMAAMRELLDLCAEHGILPDGETIAIQDSDGACERLLKAEAKYRFVIDMASIRADLKAARGIRREGRPPPVRPW